jgi:hypothetical protein
MSVGLFIPEVLTKFLADMLISALFHGSVSTPEIGLFFLNIV